MKTYYCISQQNSQTHTHTHADTHTDTHTHTHTHTHIENIYACVCLSIIFVTYHIHVEWMHAIINKIICWPLLSNQSCFWQIAGYVMGVDDHRVVDVERGSWANKIVTCP